MRDLTDSSFGRLTVLAIDVKRTRPGRTYWLCWCDCGSGLSARSDGLLSGDYVSCGCKKIDQLKIHGGTGTPEHRAWSNMIERCGTESHQNYANYGGRGITVCDLWLNSFENFLADVGPRPSPQHSIDRYPDNNGNYEPGNVRWATKKQQSQNTRSTKLTREAVDKIRSSNSSQSNLAREFGVNPSNISRVRSGEAW